MITYEEICKKFQEYKNLFVLGICYVLVFVLGFGVGSYSKNPKQRLKDLETLQKNYTTNLQKKQQNTPKEQVMGESRVAKTPQKEGECIVKGNISANGKKIYHIQGGMFYKRTQAEQCFANESEALKAGFLKSSR